MVQSALPIFDEQHGGFGSAPKFPHPSRIDLLLDWYARTGRSQALERRHHHAEKMAQGGVYDQLAGGFHRYSVDEHWIVPHFEKMSYDNSELLKNYVHAYQVLRNEFYAHVARDIIRWMDEWLSDRERGGFYASQDADYLSTMTATTSPGPSTKQGGAQPRRIRCGGAALRHWGNREMHHNTSKNVLYVASSLHEVVERISKMPKKSRELAGLGQEQNVRGTAEAPDTVCRQDGLCELERDVRFRLSAGRAGPQIRCRSQVCFALA